MRGQSGDPGHDVVLKAQRAVLKQKAFRMSTILADHAHGTVMQISAEATAAGNRHLLMEKDGVSVAELLLVDKKSYIKKPGADRYIPAPESAMTAALKDAGNAAEIDKLAKRQSNFKLIGNEVLDGKEATVYEYDTASSVPEMPGSHDKLWISKEEGLPLKGEGRVKGEMKLGDRATPVDTLRTTIWEYDATIEIVAPKL